MHLFLFQPCIVFITIYIDHIYNLLRSYKAYHPCAEIILYEGRTLSFVSSKARNCASLFSAISNKIVSYATDLPSAINR